MVINTNAYSTQFCAVRRPRYFATRIAIYVCATKTLGKLAIYMTTTIETHALTFIDIDGCPFFLPSALFWLAWTVQVVYTCPGFEMSLVGVPTHVVTWRTMHVVVVLASCSLHAATSSAELSCTCVHLRSATETGGACVHAVSERSV